MIQTRLLLGVPFGFLLLGWAAPGTPLPCLPSIAVERRDELEAHRFADAEIYFGVQGHYVPLNAALRERFLQILHRPESFYDCPGVMGCIGDEFRIRIVTAQRSKEGMFCEACLRVYPRPEGHESEGLDLVLSEEGAKALRELGDEVLGQRSTCSGR